MTKELVFHEEFPYVGRVLKDKVLDPLTPIIIREELITLYNWKVGDYRAFEGFLKKEDFEFAQPILSESLGHIKILRFHNQTKEGYSPNTPSSRLVSELEYVLGGDDE